MSIKNYGRCILKVFANCGISESAASIVVGVFITNRRCDGGYIE